jgi:hypothetical protein
VKLDEPLFRYRIRSGSRDSGMHAIDKLAMLSRMMWRNKGAYWKNLPYVACQFMARAIKGEPGVG